MTEHHISVPIPTDENGMVGRNCPDPACNRYFKLKPGTGLPTAQCHCPYCGRAGDTAEFWTEDQKRYAISFAGRRIVDPMMRQLAQQVSSMDRRFRKGPLQIRFDLRYKPTPLHSYVERALETRVTCNQCDLEFSVYGVFASCPDCRRLNALTTLITSLRAARKRVRLVDEEQLDSDLRSRFPRDAVIDVVSTFDAYGKALRKVFPGVVRGNAKSNLFQDLDALDTELQAAGVQGLTSLAGNDFGRLRWLFQARHLYEHNAGVVDHRFVAKLPTYAHLEGRMLPLPATDLMRAIDALEALARAIDQEFHGQTP